MIATVPLLKLINCKPFKMKSESNFGINLIIGRKCALLLLFFLLLTLGPSGVPANSISLAKGKNTF
jgi:hypothetical protein